MGLDMYAHRRVYVKQWEHQKPEERYTVHIERGGKSVAGIQSDRISSVEEEVMYWRKANHIHAWFVNNVQDGLDDCREYQVTRDQLNDLYKVCWDVAKASKLVKGMVYVGTEWSKETGPVEHREPGEVIEDPTVAKRLLPTRAGCFFGCTEYDEDYLNEVVRTRDWADRMLRGNHNGVPGDIYYSSSW